MTTSTITRSDVRYQATQQGTELAQQIATSLMQDNLPNLFDIIEQSGSVNPETIRERLVSIDLAHHTTKFCSALSSLATCDNEKTRLFLQPVFLLWQMAKIESDHALKTLESLAFCPSTASDWARKALCWLAIHSPLARQKLSDRNAAPDTPARKDWQWVLRNEELVKQLNPEDYKQAAFLDIAYMELHQNEVLDAHQNSYRATTVDMAKQGCELAVTALKDMVPWDAHEGNIWAINLLTDVVLNNPNATLSVQLTNGMRVVTVLDLLSTEKAPTVLKNTIFLALQSILEYSWNSQNTLKSLCEPTLRVLLKFSIDSNMGDFALSLLQAILTNKEDLKAAVPKILQSMKQELCCQRISEQIDIIAERLKLTPVEASLSIF